jgi:hypothetical protein
VQPDDLHLLYRETDCLKGLKAVVEEQLAREPDEQEKVNLAGQFKKIESCIMTSEENIKILDILENLEVK